MSDHLAVIEIELTVGRCWRLSIRLDGSCTINYREGSDQFSACGPLGIFRNFEKLTASLSESSFAVQPDHRDEDAPTVVFHDKDHQPTRRWLFRATFLTRLFAMAVDAADRSKVDLQRVFSQRWPYV